MNLPKLSERRDSTIIHEEDEDDDDMWIQLPVEQESYRGSPRVAPEPGPPNPFLNFVGNVVKEHVMKLGACIGMEGHAHPSLNALSPHRGSTASLGASASADMLSSSPDKDTAAYLFALRPFFHGLDALMEELNMNDPSRV